MPQLTFPDLNISNRLLAALEDLEFKHPTAIQEKALPVILSGRDTIGIAQTGTGKTLAYLLPLLQQLKYSTERNPKALIVVPTRELVIQVGAQIEAAAKYVDVRVLTVYGGTNINTQKQAAEVGCDIVVATPGRLYDLVLSRSVQLKSVNKLVIDEVDVMLDLGFRFQMTNILELLPMRRQNIMFSATMTDEVDAIIDNFFVTPQKISLAVSGTPLDNIEQTCYQVDNFYTKVNLLTHLLNDRDEYGKVLVFVPSKNEADRLFDALDVDLREEIGVIHSNKSQNYRIKSIQLFDEGHNRILLTTDILARGLDLEKVTHVINFDTPRYPENYMHRVGRTGRAANLGKSILLYSKAEEPLKQAVEELMDYKIPIKKFPSEVEITEELAPHEQPKVVIEETISSTRDPLRSGFHEKSEKNKKVNEGGSYRKKLAVKYKKPKTRGDKNYNLKRKI